jgi:2,4-dienoyl-CoA reductase-like NADH-dependent reductase (Old Yellow Enzyme family)
MAHLFEPLRLRDVALPNRVAVSPMCQYSAEDGVATDWHFVHYASRAVGGAGMMLVEATAVAPEGRISRGDMGLWTDRQVEPLARIVRFAAGQGCTLGVQLAHAGRKASVGLGWEPQGTLAPGEGGWPIVAPSHLPFAEGDGVPTALDADGIRAVVAQFAAAAARAREAGFRVLEVHAAHGYLLHQFLSPLSNRRGDAYGGGFDNRIRLVREVLEAVRRQWPERLPLLLRLSATDWVEGGWDLEQTVDLCRGLAEVGVDLVDVSSGGLVRDARIPAGPGFQAAFAARIRREAGIPTAAVGLITSPQQADHVVRSGQADLVMLGREILRNPYWPLQAAQALGQSTGWPRQYLRAGPPGAAGR